jgi:hypothetical protein
MQLLHVVNRKVDARFCHLLSCRHVPAECTEKTGNEPGKRQGKGMCQLLGQGDRFPASFRGLVRIAQQPQDTGKPHHTCGARVQPVAEGQAVVLPPVI